MSTQPSICIPRVFSNITEERVRRAIDSFGVGRISKIDLLERVNPTGEKYKRVFIHFEYWHDTPHARKAKEDILSGKDIKIMYDNPWFWKASLNKHSTIKAPEAPVVSLDELVQNAIKNVESSLKLVASLSEDHRTYRERRLDPKYVQQDVEQGFNHRVQKDDCRPYRERRLDYFYLKQDSEQGFKLRVPRTEKPKRAPKVLIERKKIDWANAESDSEGDEEEPEEVEVPLRKPTPRYHENVKEPVYIERPKCRRQPEHTPVAFIVEPVQTIAPALFVEEERREGRYKEEESDVEDVVEEKPYIPRYQEVLESPPPLVYGDLPCPKRRARVILTASNQ